MQDLGAEIVPSAPIPNLAASEAGMFEVMLYEFKAGLNAYLATRRGVPIKSLAELIAFNEKYAVEEEMKRFGQAIFLDAQQRGPLNDGEYLTALDRSHRLSRESLDGVMNDLKLDALVSAERKIIPPLARAGYPIITVPAGFDSDGMPGYIMFAGRAFSEPTLFRLAYAYEQATKARRPPQLIGYSQP
jgi:amidase